MSAAVFPNFEFPCTSRSPDAVNSTTLISAALISPDAVILATLISPDAVIRVTSIEVASTSPVTVIPALVVLNFSEVPYIITTSALDPTEADKALWDMWPPILSSPCRSVGVTPKVVNDPEIEIA